MSNQSKISNCRICDSTKLRSIVTLTNMPFTDEFIIKDSFGKEFLANIEICVCENCGCSQNSQNTEMDNYYNEYTYSVQSSNFAIKFMETLARRTNEKYFKNVIKPKVIEIGSGSGEQLLEFKKLGYEVLGIEPSEKLAKYANSIGVPTIHAFFDENIDDLLPDGFKQVDLIVSSYTFDHIPKPIQVLRKINQILKKGGIMIHEVHDLNLIKERNEFCLFEHEHYTYLNERTISFVYGINNFKLDTFDLLSNNEKRGNSLLAVGVKIENEYRYDIDVNFEINELVTLHTNIKASINRIENWLIEHKELNIVAYGAGGRGIMTIAAINNHHLIKYIVDKNPKASNIFSPKTHLPVSNIEKLNVDRADKILVFSFGYYDEIIKEVCDKYGYSPDQFTSILELIQNK